MRSINIWFVIVLVVLTGCGQRAEQVAVIGEPIPAIKLEDLSGETIDLSALKGQKVVLKMWASWCPICLSGLAEAEEIASDDQKDYVFLSLVAPDYQNEQGATDFVSWFQTLDYPTLPVLLDHEGKVMTQFAIRGYPTFVYINSVGQLEQILPGHVNREALEERVSQLK